MAPWPVIGTPLKADITNETIIAIVPRINIILIILPICRLKNEPTEEAPSEIELFTLLTPLLTD